MSKASWLRPLGWGDGADGRVNLLARVFLVLLVLWIPWVGWLFVVEANIYIRQYPGELDFMLMYAILGCIALAAVAVVLFGLMMLLRLVAWDRIFTPEALRWADIVLIALTVIAFLSLFVFVDFMTNGFFGLLGSLHRRVGGPGVVLMFSGLTIVAFIFRWLMIVMRGLLAEAITNRAELADVI